MGYELIYEGLRNQDPQTLQRVKAVMIAELELSVVEVQAALADPPFVLLTGPDQSSLADAYELLAEAGALVQIESTELEGGPGEEFEIDLDLEANDSEPLITAKPKPGRVYQLDEFAQQAAPTEGESYSPDEIESLLNSLSKSTKVSKSEHPTLEDLVRPLMARSKTADPIQAPAVARSIGPPAEPSLKTPPKPPADTDSQEIALEEKTSSVVPVRTRTVSRRTKVVLRNTLWAALLSVLIVLISMLALLQLYPPLPSVKVETDDTAIAPPTAKQGETAGEAPKVWQGRTTAANFELQLELTVAQEEITVVKLTLTTPEPPLLTDQEIVAGKTRAPWLERLEFESSALRRRNGHYFLATGPARAYFEARRTKSRLPVNAVVNAEIDSQSSSIKARVLLNRGFDNLPSQSFVLQADDTQDFKIFMDQKVEVKAPRAVGNH